MILNCGKVLDRTKDNYFQLAVLYKDGIWYDLKKESDIKRCRLA